LSDRDWQQDDFIKASERSNKGMALGGHRTQGNAATKPCLWANAAEIIIYEKYAELLNNRRC